MFHKQKTRVITNAWGFYGGLNDSRGQEGCWLQRKGIKKGKWTFMSLLPWLVGKCLPDPKSTQWKGARDIHQSCRKVSSSLQSTHLLFCVLSYEASRMSLKKGGDNIEANKFKNSVLVKASAFWMCFRADWQRCKSWLNLFLQLGWMKASQVWVFFCVLCSLRTVFSVFSKTARAD